MEEIARIILSAKRRRFLRNHPVFERHATVSEAELFHLATGLNFKFSLGLSKWLRMAGYGDIDGTLSFRQEYFAVIRDGTLSGCVLFAQDAAGNHYAFNPANGSIHFISGGKQFTIQISRDFASFLKELVQRDYQLAEWTDSLSPSGAAH